MILKIMEKLQKRVKAANQTCFFYDYTNVSLMTDFVPRTSGNWEEELQLHTLV